MDITYIANTIMLGQLMVDTSIGIITSFGIASTLTMVVTSLTLDVLPWFTSKKNTSTPNNTPVVATPKVTYHEYMGIPTSAASVHSGYIPTLPCDLCRTGYTNCITRNHRWAVCGECIKKYGTGYDRLNINGVIDTYHIIGYVPEPTTMVVDTTAPIVTCTCTQVDILGGGVCRCILCGKVIRDRAFYLARHAKQVARRQALALKSAKLRAHKARAWADQSRQKTAEKMAARSARWAAEEAYYNEHYTECSVYGHAIPVGTLNEDCPRCLAAEADRIDTNDRTERLAQPDKVMVTQPWRWEIIDGEPVWKQPTRMDFRARQPHNKNKMTKVATRALALARQLKAEQHLV